MHFKVSFISMDELFHDSLNTLPNLKLYRITEMITVAFLFRKWLTIAKIASLFFVGLTSK